MSKNVYRAKLTIRFRDLGPLLDMMRYDAARVRDWGYGEPIQGERTFTIELASDTPFTGDRWASFGLSLYDVRVDRV